MLRKKVASCRCKSKMGRSSGRMSAKLILTEKYWNWRRTAWGRVEHCTTTYVIHKDLQETKTLNLKILKIESFSCHIDWTRRGSSEQCISNSEPVKNYTKKSTQGHWTFLGPGGEKWYGQSNYLPVGKWQDTANMISAGSRNPEEEQQQGDQTLQCGRFEHKTFISNNSLCKWAQDLRSSCKIVWRFWYEVWWDASENYDW